MNHGSTTSMYYADPDGNRIELLIDNFATAEEGRAWVPVAIALARQLSRGAHSVDVGRRRPAAQRLGPEGLEGVPLGGRESAQRVARDQEAGSEVAGGLL